MDTTSLLIVALALGAGALSKGATGMGLPLLALPILASFFGLPQAIAVLTVPIIASNAWQVWHYRGKWRELPFMPLLAATGVAGIGVGTFFLKSVQPHLLELALGVVLVAYVMLRLARPGSHLTGTTALKLAPAVGLASGTLQGSTGITSPLLVTYLHPLGLTREAYILALSTMFLLFALTQLPALALAGLFSWEWLVQGLFALVPVVLVMPVGAALGRRMGQHVFDRIMLGFIALLGVRFMVDGTGSW